MAENGGNTAANKYDELVYEVRRRYGIVKDQLIGQSPEDLPSHYKLIGQEEAFGGLLKFINENYSI